MFSPRKSAASLRSRSLFFLLIGWLSALSANAAAPISDFIRIDQFGYRPTARKTAVIMNPQIGYDSDFAFAPSTGVNQYQIRRWDNDAVMLSGTLAAWNGGATDSTSGDKAWWFDFTALTTPGTYYVYDVGRKVGSFKFDIRADVYADVLRAACRMLYYHRCNSTKASTILAIAEPSSNLMAPPTPYPAVKNLTLLHVSKPSESPIQVAPDRDNWTYAHGEKASFRITVNITPYPKEGVSISYKLGAEKTTLVLAEGLTLDAGTHTDWIAHQAQQSTSPDK